MRFDLKSGVRTCKRSIESLENEASGSIFTSKSVFVLVTKSIQKNSKQSHFFLNDNYAFKTACPTAII